jgi:hypothetical protein
MNHGLCVQRSGTGAKQTADSLAKPFAAPGRRYDKSVADLQPISLISDPGESARGEDDAL